MDTLPRLTQQHRMNYARDAEAENTHGNWACDLLFAGIYPANALAELGRKSRKTPLFFFGFCMAVGGFLPGNLLPTKKRHLLEEGSCVNASEVKPLNSLAGQCDRKCMWTACTRVKKIPVPPILEHHI